MAVGLVTGRMGSSREAVGDLPIWQGRNFTCRFHEKTKPYARSDRIAAVTTARQTSLRRISSVPKYRWFDFSRFIVFVIHLDITCLGT